MSRRQEINNQIEEIEEHLRRLREQRDRLPEGHIAKLKNFLTRRVSAVVQDRPNKWKYEVIGDSITDNTVGVLFSYYTAIDNGQTIFRSPRVEWLKKYIFYGPEYTIKASYATVKGLVLEIREN